MANRMYYMGAATQPYSPQAGPPPRGADGTCDQYFANGVWYGAPLETGLSVWPTFRGYFQSSACYDPFTNKAFFFGNSEGAIESASYDINTGKYTNITNCPGTGSGAGDGAAIVQNHIAYIFGGFDNTSTGYTGCFSYDCTQAPGGVYNTLTVNLPNASGGGFGVSNGTFIFVGGGGSNDSGPGTNATTYGQWLKYNPASPSAFTTLTSMPTPVCEAACVLLSDNDTILVIGGSVNGTPESVGTTHVQAYSISGNSWTTKGNYPVPVALVRACLWNNTVYCAGGWNASGFSFSAPNNTANVYSYNSGSDTWALHSTMQTGLTGSVMFAAQYTPSQNVISFGAVA